ncbi:hypothetical protein QJS10_CPA10g01303 [Acorus calamus]|uniref:Uncharacterized protein n=1 Tax=Acorus calamus TaxID=4465 RepID=A0AAV9DYI0_ACOCL|nr:hypothetical protein QJS10_CPA10g01303 [Acorus calamus]
MSDVSERISAGCAVSACVCGGSSGIQIGCVPWRARGFGVTKMGRKFTHEGDLKIVIFACSKKEKQQMHFFKKEGQSFMYIIKASPPPALTKFF